MRHDVIMPALGMAQDSGLIVAWHKAAGDAVAKGDVLFEVETDKATMEVEAQADGFLNGVRAQAGEEVPVGTAVAIISAEKPDNAVARSAKATPSLKVEQTPAAKATPPEQAEKRPAPNPAAATHPPPYTHGGILRMVVGSGTER